MHNLSLKNQAVNRKLPEIQKLILFLKQTGIQVSEIARECGKSERTINNHLWQNIPITGQMMRIMHLKFGMSIDWLLSGNVGSVADARQTEISEKQAGYAVSKLSPRAARITEFVNDFLESGSEDEQIWLEMQLKIHVPQYVKFLDQHHDQ
jgi:predicted transcriptional regulator